MNKRIKSILANLKHTIILRESLKNDYTITPHEIEELRNIYSKEIESYEKELSSIFSQLEKMVEISNV